MADIRLQTRSLAVFLGASMAAHAAVIGLLPGFLRDRAPAPAVLEVTLVEPPKPLPLAPPEPELPPPPRKEPVQRKQQPAPAARERQVEQPPPVLALPSTAAPTESAFTVPAPKEAEAPPGPEPKTQVATIAVTPPTYGASYLSNPVPVYPMIARRNGIEGTVLLKVLVTPEGRPAKVELAKSSGSIHLDNAALEAVKGWRFNPARRGSEAVEGIVTIPMPFRLVNAL
jgi:protein TonB